jgi:MoCo/4Fe-4S cofactor protein with predicted Tat translocation signal
MTDSPDTSPGTPSPGAGRAFWQSLDELAQSPDFLRRLEQRFPDEYARLAELASSVDRRRFLQLTAATLALSGLAACGPARIANLVVPYVNQPSRTVPGNVQLYATALIRNGLAVGVLSRNIMARPINIEGNPDHPASRGGTDAILQAAILDLYDPDRSKWVLNNGEITDSASLITALVERFPQFHKAQGAGLRILTETVTSPTLKAQFAQLQHLYPKLRRHHWDGGWRDAERAAMRRAFGRIVMPVPKLEAAEIILAIDSDLFDQAPGHLAHARAFARRRRELATGGPGNRLYAIESTPTLTGANADNRFVVGAAQMEAVVRALAAHLGVGPQEWAQAAPSWLPAVAADLARNKGRALVHVGAYQSVSVHLLGFAINAALGAVGHTLDYLEPPEIDTSEGLASLSALVTDMRAGKVDTLLILGGNPAFTAPPDLGFDRALEKVKLSLHLATSVNETTQLCHWHVPEADPFERWSDARAFDGTATIVQPQLEPLYDGWSAHELLAVLTGKLRPQGYDIVRATWQAEAKARNITDFETFWHEAVRVGVVPDTRSPTAPVKLAPDIVNQITMTAQLDPPALTVLFRRDAWLRDGHYANNGWLQELPRPLTKLTWDNAVLVAPELAKKRGLDKDRVVRIETAAGRVEGPVWIMPGQAEDAVTVILGFGRRVVGRVGAGTGFDGFPLRSSNGLMQMPLLHLVKTDAQLTLASTQLHQHIHNPLGEDEVLRSGTVAEFRQNPNMFSGKEPTESLYPDEWHYPVYAWAMAINLSSCIGCAACVAACEAENNIPVVGKDQVLHDRQMHWIRVDRYYRGSEQAPAETLFQPVPCMQCENAPCEIVCPVEATLHDDQGINEMVYNRCVGTRFCSNNCPYKVRRFNWFNYAKLDPRLSLAWNPDLSVRAWGVMEKCTYCIQRIREAEINADRENRRVRDGEVKTACQAACPTEAIVFGNLDDKNSAVVKRKNTPLDYGMLAGLNTRPRTTYEARLTNPNPEITES